MSIDLSELNKLQQEVVKITEGPVLILAGAGSGKTKVLTYRVAYLIADKKIPPENILVQTFTNKAAGEMKNRIIELIGRDSGQPVMGTFHSFCARILRKEGYLLGLSPGFSIYDENDALDAVKQAMATLNLATQKISPPAVRNTISGAKNELINEFEYPQYARGYFQENVAKIYLEYQKILKQNQALDFDDLLMETIKLFQTEPATLVKYQIQFRYILVDEYQDTNAAQYKLIQLLSKKYQNLCVVGDASQCLLPDTKVSTPTGLKSIQTIKPGEMVYAAAGRGKTHTVAVQKLRESTHKGTILIIKTKSGKTLTATPNHILFARLNKNVDIYYVYLMYRQDKGYRIGIAKGVRTPHEGRSEIGLLVRSNQESADKMWILKVCRTRSDANYWEHYMAILYGIPSIVFSTSGRKMLIAQEQIDNLFASIDTKERVKKIFDDYNLFEEYPHHRPKGIASRISPDRQIVYFTLFSDKRPSIQSPWCGHRVSINTSDAELEKRLKKLGHYIRAGNKDTWRIETCHWSYERALELAEKISRDSGGLVINHSAFIVDNKKFLFTPASHLRETMQIGVFENGEIILDEVLSVEEKTYNGPVYDLDIDILHNYIADGIVVHNSIYGFRGADFRNIVNFQKDYPGAKVFNLEQNYRSTQIILDAALSIISENRSHPILKLWTDKKTGAKITIFQAPTEVEEALFIIGQILQTKLPLSSYAILYRTNAQSRSLEEAFLKSGVPYKLVGGVQFYQRKEIKDVLSYLRLIHQPQDSVAKKRIEKIGKGRAGKFYTLAEDLKTSQKELVTLDILDLILEVTDYLNYLDDGTEQGKLRIENVKELRSVAEEFPNLIQFLENVALVQNEQMPDQSLEDQKEAVTLMTIHASKGLEFSMVFLVGMEEGLFPHSRSMLEVNEMEEERRLAYVGITRAKEKIFLTYTRSRLYFGTRSNSIVSRFVASIPEELIDSNSNLKSPVSERFDDDVSTLQDDEDWLNA